MKPFLFSLLVSLLLWLSLGMLLAQPRSVKLPLLIRGLASDLAVSEAPDEVKVFLKSAAREALALEAFLDLSQVKTPVRLKERVQIVGAQKILAYSPREAEVSIAPAASRLFKIEPEVTEFPPAGYAIKRLVLEPAELWVEGSERILNSLARLSVKLSLRNQRASRSFALEPQAINAQGKELFYVSFSPSMVSLSVEIAPGEDSKAVVVEPIFKDNLPAGFTLQEVSLEPKVVSIRGATDLLQNLSSLKTTPISLSGRFQDFEEQVALNLPWEVALLGGGNLIKVKVKLASSVTTTRLKVVPRYLNLAESLELAKSSPNLVEVVLSGSADKLGSTTAFEIKLGIPLTGLISGTHRITLDPAMVQASSGLQAIAFEPQEVEVMLKRK